LVDRHVYGGVFQARLDYVKEHHGKDGLDRLFKTAKSHGYKGPVNIKEFKVAKPYQFDFLLILMKAYVETFGKSDFAKMSREAAKRKGIIGFFIKWAGSPDLLIKKAQEYWPNFYDFGRLEGEIINDNTGIVRGYDISPDPIFCGSLTDYFTGVFDNLNLKELNVKQVKCVHEDDKLCEWKISWK